MKYKILLIKPFYHREVFDISSPDLGFGYLATALKKIDVTVKILDLSDFQDWKAILYSTLKQEDFIAAGIKFYSKDIPWTRKTLQFIKLNFPQIPLLGGGPHPSGDPLRVLKQVKELDFAFKGEAEVGLPILINRLIVNRNNFKINHNDLKEIPGLIFREYNEIKVNKSILTENIDDLGLPAWEILNPHKYKNNWSVVDHYTPIMISRGCPFNCSYCAGSTITGKKMRYRSLVNVKQELQLLISTYNIRHFSICDDNFTYNKEYVKQFCKMLVSLNEKITWDCAQNAIRLDTLDKQLLVEMENSGCKCFTIAIESGSDKILKDMKKGFTIEDVKNAVKLIKQNSKIRLKSYFIIGYPVESKEDIIKTIKLACSLNLDQVDFFIYTPHPGSPIYNKILKMFPENEMSWESFLYSKASIGTVELSSQDVKRLHSYAYLKYFARPKHIAKRIVKHLTSERKYAARNVRNIYELVFSEIKSVVSFI